MSEPERKRWCLVPCEPSDVWLKTCRKCGNPIMDTPGISFPGYDVLSTPISTPPAFPGETRAEYHQRVYGRPYPHERLWPGNGLAEDGP